jgi:hypothetical protein
MKIKKKLFLPLAMGLGVLMLISAVFADSLTQPAYDQLKDAVKYTAGAVGTEISSLTSETTIVLKDNDQSLLTQKQLSKLDLENNRKEDTGIIEVNGAIERSSYTYSDSDGHIWYDSNNDVYYVNKYSSTLTNNAFRDPFDFDEAEDVEKILDALVGNLKNYLFVSVKDDKSREFTASLTDAQIPSLINAVVSFASKQYFSNSYTGASLPKITSDVFIKNVTGKASVNEDGFITGFYLKGLMAGKDSDDIDHDVSVEILMKIDGINSTVVSKPDLSGKNVEEYESRMPEKEAISSKFEGTYRANIVLDNTDSFEKIGEKTLVIEEIADGKIKGSYFEYYKDGYEDRISDISEFTFEATINDPYSIQIAFTDRSGKLQTGNIYFDMNTSNVQLWLNTPAYQKNTDSSFIRVFED